MTWTLHRRWLTDTSALLAELRPWYEYDDDGRATGYLPADLPWLRPLVARLGTPAVLFQAYRDGRAGTYWHIDEVDRQVILSLGATRTFGVDRFHVPLDGGDLLTMIGPVPHAVLTDADVAKERCSLVFRGGST